MTDDDALLMDRLGLLAREVDPVPAGVTELSQALFGLQRLDADYAALVADSDVALAGVRSAGSDVRLLTFEAGELVVEAQVTGAGDRHTVLGQVVEVSAPHGTVRLEKSDQSGADIALDELGNFRFDGVSAGTMRLAVELPDGRTVATAWFSV